MPLHGLRQGLAAIRSVAEGVPSTPALASPPADFIGYPALRQDAVGKTTGRTRFADDLHMEGISTPQYCAAPIPTPEC